MTTERVQSAASFIAARIPTRPSVAVVLGSGLGALAEKVTPSVVIPYVEIPNFHSTTVAGHHGRLVAGTLRGVPAIVLQGRIHLYEGHTPGEVVLPVRAMRLLGATTLIVTNAAGGVNPSYEPGDLMVIRDHLNLLGANPLTGPNDESLGPRFPDMSDAYDRELGDAVIAAARARKVRVHEGVYAGLPGPAYETPAEIRMLRALGADAVGMSTVMEVIAARHMGMRVCGVSLITNKAAGVSAAKLSHEHVHAAARDASMYFVDIMLEVIGAVRA